MPNDNGTSAPYRFAVIALKHMIVDAYQRPLTSFVDKIEHEYNPALIGTLCVSERSKTKYALIDGQTRAEGMKRVGETDAPCIVYVGLSLADEAELFAKFQTERRGMTSATRFKAEVIAGHPEAVEVDAVVREAGYMVDHNSNDANALRAVAALEYVFRGTYGRPRGRASESQGGHARHADPELLGAVLTTLRAAWPELPDTAKSAVMIRGLGWYLARDPATGRPRESEIDMGRLVDRLGKVTPSELAKRAEALREGRGMSGNSPAYMAEAIDVQYRKR